MVVSFEVYGESVLGVATSLVNEETRHRDKIKL